MLAAKMDNAETVDCLLSFFVNLNLKNKVFKQCMRLISMSKAFVFNDIFDFMV